MAAFCTFPCRAAIRRVLDFNKAFNPPCALNDFATCPLPPPQNRLQLTVEAGELKYAGGPRAFPVAARPLAHSAHAWKWFAEIGGLFIRA